MKKFIAIYLSWLTYSNCSYSQTEIGIGLGGNKILNKPTGVDLQSSFSVFFYVKKDFVISNQFLIEPQFKFNNSTYFIDGYFTKTPLGTTKFDQTPSNYKQNRLVFSSVTIPVLVKYYVYTNEQKQGLALGVGPYIDVLVQSRQLYKVDENSFNIHSPIDNKVQGGLLFDFGTIGKSSKSNPLGFGGGIQYQLTNYAKGDYSFKPLAFYLRCGLVF